MLNLINLHTSYLVTIRQPSILTGIDKVVVAVLRLSLILFPTQMALAALYPTMSLGDTLMMRLVFVLLGTLVVLSIIFVFLNAGIKLYMLPVSRPNF